MKKKIVIAGGTGFLAQCIFKNMKDDNITFVVLTRSAESSFYPDGRITYCQWDGRTIDTWQKELEGADAVTNLAGRSVNCRYTEANRKEILESRIDSTNAIGIAINRCEQPPKVWINAGSAAIYGNRGEELLTEESEPGEGFSAGVCRQWEETFYDIITPLSRKVFLRIGFVLGKDGGALKPMARLASWGLGGPQGSGEQYMSWLHEKDFCGIIEKSLADEGMEGTYNCCAPEPVPNKNFMAGLRSAVGRNLGVPLSGWVLRTGSKLIGTEAELVLNGRRVLPKKLLEAGYQFQFTTLQPALYDLLIHPYGTEGVDAEKLETIRSKIFWWIVLGIVIACSPLLAFLGEYGSTLFVLLPTSVGFSWGMIKSRGRRMRLGELMLSTITIGVFLCLLFLVMGVEGLICVVMALPIIVPLMALGTLFAYLVQRKIWARLYAPMFILLLNPVGVLYDIGLQDFENSTIKTEMIINASDKKIWEQLEQPFEFGKSDFFFLKKGVSYPVAMRLEKNGNCNMLACEYSNGNLNAVVDSLQPFRLLRFSIKEPPVSMSETSIYPNIEPKHVRSTFFVDYGEFRIEPISNSSCKVIATTAYRYKVGPAWYWKLWSDRLVNQMHLHVLEKLKEKTEEHAHAN